MVGVDSELLKLLNIISKYATVSSSSALVAVILLRAWKSVSRTWEYE